LSAPRVERLLAYTLVNEFEALLFAAAGTFEYRDGGIAFGGERGKDIQHWDADRKARLKRLKPRLEEAATLRHWLHHSTGGGADLVKLLDSMDHILYQLGGIAANDLPAPLPEDNPPAPRWPMWRTALERLQGAAAAATCEIEVRLALTGQRMTMPMGARVKRQWRVGREDEIELATASLLQRGARVLIHGGPGMGKDVVAAEVVRDARVTNCPGVLYQKWFIASTDTVLRAQLIGFFQTHLPAVVAGCMAAGAEDEARALACIRGWLAANDNWLFVLEDASVDTACLWECFPSSTGRLLVTSQGALHTSAAVRGRAGYAGVLEEGVVDVPLANFTTDQSLALWRSMDLFARAPVDVRVGDAVVVRETRERGTVAARLEVRPGCMLCVGCLPWLWHLDLMLHFRLRRACLQRHETWH